MNTPEPTNDKRADLTEHVDPVKCPSCRKEFTPVLEYHKLGRIAYCPHCKRKLLVQRFYK